MRLHVALSRVDRGRLTGAEMLYVPKAFDATLRVRLEEEVGAGDGAAAAVGDDAAAGSDAGAGGTGLRRRRRGGEPAAAAAPATMAEEAGAPAATSAVSSPLAWFGPTAHPRIASAQATAVDVVKAAVAAARARRRLAALLDGTG